ncbi:MULTISPECIES: proton-conducting transporter membrane subunit [unclassified Guyparkeria]|uniref:proton-conducting transporter transmembrane domain-containing protein n=1 Tax=unclassified Guyparkeria TaxID=2626246 RepID=UPI0007336B21|nr:MULTISPECIES: proton-conducting transporter membrane subunit [unclassified Guyparkeria]KTG16226.1 NADH dehydrogenase [Guyparkeria sp. XI15]OAE85077.1 NADH dehydrogenase [Guyparkeria sp. WRN-7]
MEMLTNWPVAGLLLLAMPLLLVVAAIPATSTGIAAARRYRQRVRWAALAALSLALVAVVAYLAGSREGLTVAALPLPGDMGALALSVQVDQLTLALAVLVALVVTLIARYSERYLDGDPQQARFFRLLALTAGFFMLVVTSANLALFTLAIILTGFSLHKLLLFYPDRPRAVMATHKKSLFSRSADACLVGATLLIGHQVGSLEFDAIASWAGSHEGGMPLGMHAAAFLIVLAAILKSAQFPFHGWLLQVMEAPTPVSALMHAGIVYSGAIIVLRTSEFLLAQGSALFLLAIVGLATLVIASLVMLTQTAVKSSLAWSTTGQLGFMLLELGLGLFALALLHLVGHSLYKAHAFLAAGSIPDQLRQPKPAARRRIGMGTWALTVAASLALTAALAAALGLQVSHEPALSALVAIVALAVAQLVLKAITVAPSGAGIARATGVAALMAAIYFALHEAFVSLFGPTVAAIPDTLTPAYGAMLALTTISFLFLAWLQGPGRDHFNGSGRKGLFVHLYNGLYVDLLVERAAHRLWPHKVGQHRSRHQAVRTQTAATTQY